MVKLKLVGLAIIVTVVFFIGLISVIKQKNISVTGVLRNVDYNTRGQELMVLETIALRNNISRLLNAKLHELAKLQCEKVERENKTIEQTSQTGGWCIHDAKELGSGGFHATDLKLVPALIKFFKGKRVASFGDGPGRYKKLLDESGQLAVYDAFDGAPYSESLSEGRVKFLDLTIPQYGLPLYDYVISLEVAEHIPKEYEAIYVDNVIRHAKEGIVLSWAWPGQEGHSHVNGKALEDVIKLLKDKGFEHDPSSSEVLKQSSTFMWLKKSTNVYKRKEINEELLKMNT